MGKNGGQTSCALLRVAKFISLTITIEKVDEEENKVFCWLRVVEI